MTRSETFTTRLSKETALWVEHEARRTRRSKSAILASLAEEAARTRRFPGIAFRGSEIEGRRAWIPGAGFDVWQIIEGYQAKGSLARLLEESELTERQVRLALTYYEHYPEEIDEAIGANQLSQEELHILYPTIIPPVASGQQCGGALRLLLDAHLSGKHIASVLRARGHDVRAANEEPGLEGMNDPGLWLLAVQEGRILVTADIKDFMPIIQRWAEAGASHPGCILIPGNVPLGQFGRIIAGITAALEAMPEREDWLDYVHYLSQPRAAATNKLFGYSVATGKRQTSREATLWRLTGLPIAGRNDCPPQACR